MVFREVRVFEVREILRLGMRGESLRAVERLAGVDRKTVRRYVEAATGLGLVRDGGEGQLDEQLIGSVVEAVRPHRSDGHGDAWRVLVANNDQIKAWLDSELTVVKVHDLLTRRGWWCPSERCTAMPWRCSTTAEDEGARFVSPMGARGTSARSTSGAWAHSSIPTPTAPGPPTP